VTVRFLQPPWLRYRDTLSRGKHFGPLVRVDAGVVSAPRITQLAPVGSGRYIAVDRDGELWRGETKRQKEGGEEYIQWKPLPSQFPRDNN
jgi:hypothetical protein